MGKRGKERARERRQLRLQEISQLRTIPYSPSERWWSEQTVAVVTGSNRGIGYEIARQLAVNGLHVVLTSRDVDRGQQAADLLRQVGLSVAYSQLDITDSTSIEQFAQSICQIYGGLDILVNNAGVNFNRGSDNSVEFSETVIGTNYYGTKSLIERMLPLMRPSPHTARILNVSSRLGRANGRRNRIGDPNLREQLTTDDSLSEELIDEMLTEFLKQVKEGNWSANGWPQMYTDYSLSKLALNSYTRLTARRLSDRPEGQKIYINCFCPGWVKTGLTDWQGNLSAEEGADTGVWLSLLPPEKITNGKFYAERREISF